MRHPFHPRNSYEAIAGQDQSSWIGHLTVSSFGSCVAWAAGLRFGWGVAAGLAAAALLWAFYAYREWSDLQMHRGAGHPPEKLRQKKIDGLMDLAGPTLILALWIWIAFA